MSYYDERASQLRIVQHLSAACRAARSKELKNLPAAWILRQMDDIDAERCRNGRAYYPGTLMFLLIAFPTTLLLFNKKVGESFIESIINTTAASVELFGAFLASESILAIVLPLGFLAIFVYFVYGGINILPLRLSQGTRTRGLLIIRFLSFVSFLFILTSLYYAII